MNRVISKLGVARQLYMIFVLLLTYLSANTLLHQNFYAKFDSQWIFVSLPVKPEADSEFQSNSA